ncbi:MAG TPA: DUF3857 domain-containing transglutaminase family protein [Chitinophagaceae bacterium]|nr:DUF3857 domain-containing transglutaminase family protein [Chitinophagaceae bacterium]
MRFYIVLLMVFCARISFATENPYTVTAIAANLVSNANVIKRMEDTKLEVISASEVILSRKYVLTILNEKGAEYASNVVGYDKFRSIRSFDGALYDAAGKEIRKLKTKEIQDVSAVDDNNLMDDSRMKVHSFNYSVYPYSVMYEVEIKFSSTYFLPTWMPQNYEHLSIENSRFSITTPVSYAVRYKAFNYKGEPFVSESKDKKTITWQAAAMPAIERPYASPKWNELTTCVYFAPSDFQMQQFKGNANSWESLGKFQIALNKDRDVLPKELVEKVKQLTAESKSEEEKVKILYQFLQKNTRYISIQLGIGGLQPFEASFVAQNGYGDCKALSNYMVSLLKAAGIKSYYTWVHAGSSMDDKYIMEDFPSDQFNHIIVCVPIQKDTMWLECTSQTDPAGYMGKFTGNRKVLLITEEGGKLVSTPRYGIGENLQLRSIKGVLDNDGNLDMKVVTHYTGLQQDDLSGMLHAFSKDKVKQVLNEELNLSSYEINSFTYNQKKDVMPQVAEVLDISVSGFATVSGKRIFITPNILNRSGTQLTEQENRTYDYQFDMAYKDVDTVEIELAEGYVLETLPPYMELKTKFGNYSSSVKFVKNKLQYIRVREQFSGRYPKSDALALSAFLNAIYKCDRTKIVLVKKEG